MGEGVGIGMGPAHGRRITPSYMLSMVTCAHDTCMGSAMRITAHARCTRSMCSVHSPMVPVHTRTNAWVQVVDTWLGAAPHPAEYAASMASPASRQLEGRGAGSVVHCVQHGWVQDLMGERCYG
jgi:hypothetical protein